MPGTRITVIGLGYVGLANAVLLARDHPVIGLDIDATRVAAINAGTSPIADTDIATALADGGLQLQATTDATTALATADYVIIATPTDYDPGTNHFDTASVEAAIRQTLALNPTAIIVIKSTVPVGFTTHISAALATDRVIFSPEFLREDRALHDSRHPSRIVVGEHSDRARRFAELLRQAAADPAVPVLLTGPTEAEAIKLFANTYLALRVAFFNELDSYALIRGLDSRQIIAGIGHDPRIGHHYNNPSFGYGGYCLPKDSRQLLANYADVPQDLIGAVVAANRTRKDFLVEQILARQPQVVGIHRLVMKAGSDNFRHSAVQGIMRRLVARGVQLVIHEPTLDGQAEFYGIPVLHDLGEFKATADVILANRMTPELADVAAQVFTRDLFGRD